MSTKSIAKQSLPEDQICQGDIFKNVKYNYIDSENDAEVQIVEFEFPMALIISQACDVVAMEEIYNSGKGKPTKFMPSILMCPIYDQEIIRNGEHIKEAYNALSLEYEASTLYNSKEYELIKKDWHYRYHALEVLAEGEEILKNFVVDFKHYFTVPMSYLIQNKENRILHLDDLYAEQLTLKFATFLSRVAIPDVFGNEIEILGKK